VGQKIDKKIRDITNIFFVTCYVSSAADRKEDE
jgi:hypothetical protein